MPSKSIRSTPEPRTLESALRRDEVKIDALLKRFRKPKKKRLTSPKKDRVTREFGVDKIIRCSKANAKVLAKFPTLDLSAALHNDWNAVDDGRMSLACPFEQFRTRAAILGAAYDALVSTTRYIPGDKKSQWSLVTVANPKHRRPKPEIHQVDHQPIQRHVQAAITLLKKSYPGLIAISVFELSAGKSLSGVIEWEPHVH